MMDFPHLSPGLEICPISENGWYMMLTSLHTFSGANLADVCTYLILKRLYFETLDFSCLPAVAYIMWLAMLIGAPRLLALLWPQSMSVSYPVFVLSLSGSSKKGTCDRIHWTRNNELKTCPYLLHRDPLVILLE